MFLPLPLRRRLRLALLLIFLGLAALARASVTDLVDFNSGTLTDDFNVYLSGTTSGYSLAPAIGLSGSQAVDLAAGSADATLLLKARGYDLAATSGIELSMFFKKQATTAQPAAIQLGLFGKNDFGVKAIDDTATTEDAFICLRLGRNSATNALRFQTQMKLGTSATIVSGNEGADLALATGNWYQLRVTFVQVNASTVQVSGSVWNADATGIVGTQVAAFAALNLTNADVASDSQLWVGLRGYADAGADAWDNLAIVQNGVNAPRTPGGLTVRGASTTQVDLSWNDLASIQTNMVVARGTSIGGPYTDIATLPPNATTFSDTGRTANTTYFYVVRAVNPFGDSANSNEDSASTFATGGIQYFVDAGAAGNDTTHDGKSVANAFKTIQKAASVAVVGDTVNIRAGTYRETITPTNSGTATKPITFKPYVNAGVEEAVTVSGVDIIDDSSGSGSTAIGAWTQAYPGVTGKTEIYKILLNSSWAPPSGRNMVYVNGQLLVEARFPNTTDPFNFDRYKMAAADAGSVDAASGSQGDPTAVPPVPADAYSSTYTDAALAGFGAAAWTGGRIRFCPGKNWSQKMGTITGNTSGAVTFDWAWDGSTTYTPNNGDPYFLFGKLIGLDAEGECFYDDDGSEGGVARTLYLWKPGGGSPVGSTVEMNKSSTRMNGFNLGGRSWVTLKNLRFTGNASANSGSSTAGLNFDGCTFDHCAFAIDLGVASPQAIYIVGTNQRVANCVIDGAMSVGIRISGGSGHVIENNVVRDCSGSCFDVRVATDCILRRNTLWSSGDHTLTHALKGAQILNNDVSFTGKFSTDLAGINSNGTGDLQGTEIGYNWVHDMIAPQDYSNNRGWNGCLGIRQDGGGTTAGRLGVSDTFTHHNIVWNTTMIEQLTMWCLDNVMPNYGNAKIRVWNNTVEKNISIIETSPTSSAPNAAGIEFRNNLAGGTFVVSLSPDVTALVNTGNLYSKGAIAGNFAGPTGWTSPTNRNFTLRADALALDAGTLIAGYSDGFAGDAPDIGALERGVRPFLAGAVIGDSDVAALTFTYREKLDGTPQLVVGGLPLGRSLPLTFLVKVGAAPASNDFFQNYDTATHTATATFTLDTSSVSGVQTISVARDGIAFSATSASVNVPHIVASGLNAVSASTATGGTFTLTGANFTGSTTTSFTPIAFANLQVGDLSTNPLPLTLDTAALIAAGKMRADGGDLRFTNFDGTASYSYWIESGLNTAQTLVWLKAAATTSSGYSGEDQSTIFMSYGNAALTSASNLSALWPELALATNDVWLKANAITGVTDGAALAAWNDSSTANHDGAQATAALKPTFHLNGLNGLPTVRFDGVDDFMSCGDLSAASPFHFFAAYVNPAPGSVINQRLASAAVAGTNDYQVGMVMNPDLGTGGTVTAHTTADVGNVTSTTNKDLRNLVIGRRNNSNVEQFKGDLAEIVGFTQSLSTSQRDNVLKYLNTKYGVTAIGAAAPDFASTINPLTITVGGVRATNVTIVSPTQITFTLPAASAVTAPTPATISATAPGRTSASTASPLWLYTTPIDLWRINSFLNSPGGPAGPNALNLADFDGDGISNLLEYSRGTSATAPSPNTLPLQTLEVVGASKYQALTVTKSPSATDCIFTVEVASAPGGPWSSTSTTTVMTNTATQLKVRDNTPVGTSPRFIRLQVAVP